MYSKGISNNLAKKDIPGLLQIKYRLHLQDYREPTKSRPQFQARHYPHQLGQYPATSPRNATGSHRPKRTLQFGI